jgi:hypothetical protein
MKLSAMPLLKHLPKLNLLRLIATTLLVMMGLIAPFLYFRQDSKPMLHLQEQSRLCMDLTHDHLLQIDDMHTSVDPAVYLITPPGKEYDTGNLCMGALVTIPNQYSKKEDYGAPIEDYPPDSIYLNIEGVDFNMVPKTETNFTVFKLANKTEFRYYHLELKFRDADVYKITGYLECKIYKLMLDINHLWNIEDKNNIFWNPFPLKFLRFEEKSNFSLSDSYTVTIKGTQMNSKLFADLPVCKNGNALGRWVRGSLVETHHNQSVNMLKNDWTTFRDSSTHFQDAEGKIWIPYDCKYLPISYTQFTNQLSKSNAHLHFYGDSNIRRPLKAFSTRGAWCTTMNNPFSIECTCEDHARASVSIPQLNDNSDPNYVFNVGGSANVSLYWLRVDGFSYDNSPDFSEKLSHQSQTSYHATLGVSKVQTPLAVIFNLGNYQFLIFSELGCSVS